MAAKSQQHVERCQTFGAASDQELLRPIGEAFERLRREGEGGAERDS